MNQKKKPQSHSSSIQKNKGKPKVDDTEELLKLLDKEDLSDSEFAEIAVLISQRTTTTTISGPIPDPFTLALYEKILPGSAKDIIQEFKDQSKHRRDLEMIVIPSREKQSSLGQIMAFILGLISLLGSIYLAVIGERAVAAILASIGLSLTGSYFYGVFKNYKSLKEKNIPNKKNKESTEE